MISPELIRRFSFFAGLDMEQINTLAQVGNELTVPAGHVFFQEWDELHHFYLALDGSIALFMDLTDQEQDYSIYQQLLRRYDTRVVVVKTVSSGGIFGWSGFIPPYIATAGARAEQPGRVVAFDCRPLRSLFEEDCRFGYMMTTKAVQVVRDRLHDTRIEVLAHIVMEERSSR